MLFATATLALCAQKQVGSIHSRAIGHLALSQAKAVTDTVAPGDWANDPNTQLTQFGALCDDGSGGEVNCGYIVGTNGYGDKAKAQQFLLLDNTTALVEGVIFWFYAKSGDDNAVVHARLYNTTGNGNISTGTVTNAPSTVAANKDFTLAEVDTTNADGFTAVMFDSPTWVQNEFALGFDIADLGTTDSIGLLCTSSGIVGFPDLSWEKWSNNSWNTLAYSWDPVNLNVDLCIFALLDFSSVGIDEPGALNNMRLSILSGNISTGQLAIAYDVVRNGDVRLTVHNSAGKVMYEERSGARAAGRYYEDVNTAGWAEGTYYLTLFHDGLPITKRFLVQ